MGAEATTKRSELVPVAKADIVEAWSILERLVVSLRKIGSYHAAPAAEVPMTPQQRQDMSNALEEFFSAEFFAEAARARRGLDKYLADDEAEAISDSLKYWEPK